MLEKLHKKFTYLCNLDNLCPKFAERKRGSDGRPSSLLEWDISYPKFVEKKQESRVGIILFIKKDLSFWRKPESSNNELYKIYRYKMDSG